MKNKIRNISKNFTHYIGTNEDDFIIVEYGIQQLLIIFLNTISVIIIGIIWNELMFISLIYICMVVLRPYIGGYHANTEGRCYLLSVIAFNLMPFLRKSVCFSRTILLAMTFFCLF